MTFMRIATDDIKKHGQERRPYSYGYYFTLSKWQAMAHLSDHLILESHLVDPYSVFPNKATNSMRYGEAHGLVFTAMEYKNSEDRPMGAICMVEGGNKLLGFYVARYV